jgi:ESCRT-II complex subunit VPS22
MRRGVGAAGLKKRKEQRAKKAELGGKLAVENLAHVSSSLATFKANLEAFARKYKKQINSDPVFRSQFAKMCSSIGVDPLASNKGFWAEVLGVGDFYYELGVQIVDVCLATRAQNGGIMGVGELAATLARKRPPTAQAVAADDILRAVEKLRGLGSGFKVMSVGSGDTGRLLIVSVPMELSDDHGALLGLAQERQSLPAGAAEGLTVELARERLRWGADRLARTLELLVREGVLWVDEWYVAGEGLVPRRQYWAPSVSDDNVFDV